MVGVLIEKWLYRLRDWFRKEVVASKEVQHQRRAICNSCEHGKGRATCSACGCILAAKIRASAATCPEDKWSL